MPNITIKTFAGIVPRKHPTALPAGFAEVAHDVNLTHGTLRPWREPLAVQAAAPTTRTIYPWGCCWREWDRCVEVVPWMAGCPRLYVTGDRAYPTVEVLNEDCTHTTCRLGVPSAESAPSASAFAAPSPMSEVSENRAYVYTYVNHLGEEGAPSWASNEITIDDGAAATVTGFETPPPEWGVKEINVYRRASGFVNGMEQIEVQITDFFLVATVPVGTASYVDALPNMELGPALATRDYLPPPAGLRGLIELTNSRTLVGFVGNKVHFSANGQPWNWPSSQELTLDDNVLAMRETGGKLFVATDGRPYTISGSAECDSMKCREVIRHDYPFPMVTCCSDRGAVETPMGMVYVGTSGLVLLAGPKQERLLTDGWYAQDDWRGLKPETMRLGYHDGAVYCVSDAEAFVLQLDAQLYADTHTYRLSTISDRPSTIAVSRNGEMFFLEGGEIRQWNAGTTLRPFKWQSATLMTPGRMGFHAARVRCDGAVAFTLEAGGHTVHARPALGTGSFRLKPYGRYDLHSVTFEGTQQVWAVHLGTSFRELDNRSG